MDLFSSTVWVVGLVPFFLAPLGLFVWVVGVCVVLFGLLEAPLFGMRARGRVLFFWVVVTRSSSFDLFGRL